MAGSPQVRASAHLREQGPRRTPALLDTHKPGGLPGQAHCPASSCAHCTRASGQRGTGLCGARGRSGQAAGQSTFSTLPMTFSSKTGSTAASSRTSSNTTPHSNSSLTFLK